MKYEERGEKGIGIVLMNDEVEMKEEGLKIKYVEK